VSRTSADTGGSAYLEPKRLVVVRVLIQLLVVGHIVDSPVEAAAGISAGKSMDAYRGSDARMVDAQAESAMLSDDSTLERRVRGASTLIVHPTLLYIHAI
jgi:hypothetical protein